MRAGHRLRSDDLDFDRERRRRDLQLPARVMAVHFKFWVCLAGRGRAGRDEPARRQGIGAVAAADLHRLRHHARVADHLRAGGARLDHSARGPQRDSADRREHPQHGLLRAGADVPARLQPRRRHLYRDRGGQQRPADPARAAHRDRQAHDGLHGGVAGLRRRRHPLQLHAVRRRTASPARPSTRCCSRRWRRIGRSSACTSGCRSSRSRC